MKKNIVTLLLCLFVITSYSQDVIYNSSWSFTDSAKTSNSYPDVKRELDYFVHSAYLRPVSKDSLLAAKSLNDLISGYPKNWLADFVTSEIFATYNGKTLKAVASSDVLSTDQRMILKTVDIGTDITVNIKYKSINSATDKIETREMNFVVTMVPEFEAQYPGGNNQLKKYLKENAVKRISDKDAGIMEYGKVRFAINEKGEAVDARIAKSSGISEIDKLLLDVINRMPKWKPAQDSKGVKYKQQFELGVGMQGC